MNSLLNFTDSVIFLLSYIFGFIILAIFDTTVITHDFWTFLIISPILATLTGVFTFFAIALPLTAIFYLNDIVRFLYKKIKHLSIHSVQIFLKPFFTFLITLYIFQYQGYFVATIIAFGVSSFHFMLKGGFLMLGESLHTFFSKKTDTDNLSKESYR